MVIEIAQGRNTPSNMQVKLERIIGISASHNNALTVSPATGDVAYPAGCMVCLYNAKRNKQVRIALSGSISRVNQPIARTDSIDPIIWCSLMRVVLS